MIISSVRNGPLLSRGAVVKATDQRHLLQNPTYVRGSLCLGSSGGTTAVLHTYFLSHKLGGFHQRDAESRRCMLHDISGSHHFRGSQCRIPSQMLLQKFGRPDAPDAGGVESMARHRPRHQLGSLSRMGGLTMTPLEEVERAHNV